MEPLLFFLLSVVASALDDTGSSAEARSAMASFLGLNRTRRTLSPEGSCFGPRVVASGPVDAAGRLLQTPRLIWPKGQGPGGRWTVLSLFDGIGSAAVALQSLGVPVGRYLSVETDPSKNQVLHRHFPSIESAGDVRALDPTRMDPVDLLIGGSPCFVAGTLILTRAGLRRIETVSVGDEVWTHESRWRRVTSTMCREASSTLRLTGGFHEGIVTTDDHPFWSSSGRLRIDKPQRERRRGNWYDVVYGQPEWTAAMDMPGRYWATPVLDGADQPPTIPTIPQRDGTGSGARGMTITPELMWVMGAWVGDGWVRRRAERGGGVGQMIICTPTSGMTELTSRIDLAGLHATICHGRTCNKLVVSKRSLAMFLVQHFGEKAHGKRLPGWLYFLSVEMRQAFLDGYVWADGHTKERGWSSTSVSRELTYGIALLATSLGLVCSTYFTKRLPTVTIEGRKCNQRDAHCVVARIRTKQTSAFRIGSHSFSKCRRAMRCGPATVYNLSVEEDESYVADGLVVHNCTDLSVANPDRDGLCGARSSLFWEFLRVLKATRPTWWIFENVDKLSEEDEATLTRELGVGPFVLDAGVVSAQRRVRLYWTNLTRVCVPTDRGRRLREVLLPYEAVGPDELRPAPERMSSIPKGTSRSYLEGGKGHAFLPDIEDKSPTLVRNLRRGSPYDVVVQGGRTRRLSPLEAERLQGFPDGYTAGLTRRLRLAGVGDAMSVPVLVHLLAHLGLAPARG